MTSREKWGWALMQLLLALNVCQGEDLVCKQRGDAENPQLSKDGDIILGGILSFHSSWKNKEESYTEKPLPLECTRYRKSKKNNT